VARRLGDPDVAWDDGVEDLVPEVPLDLGSDLERQARPAIEHREDDPLDRQPGVRPAPHEVERLHELGQPLQGVVLALERDDGRVGGDEGVQREKPERGGAVHQDEIEPGSGGHEGLAKAGFPAGQLDQLDLRPDEIRAPGEECEIGQGSRPPRLLGGGLPEQHLVEGRAI
jgi:hypothetical protein